jgi:hypothetical protein
MQEKGARDLVPCPQKDRARTRANPDFVESTIPSEGNAALAIVVECKLIRMRTQPHWVNFVVEFVINPVFDEVFGEHSTYGQKVMVLC